MIEEIVVNYLSGKFPYPILTEVPQEPHFRYIIVEKLGSGEENYISSAVIAVKSIAESLYQAALLNEFVKEAMKEMIELDDICRVSLNSDYPFTNPETKVYRYQAVFDITHY